ncbi:ATP-dependent helicase HrpB [Endozoicomonas arenosclerae]|uniref:ATP-dependent helicase HrpB n=1 Tax=Endozoicomonas arenosclerae TaxID=1633495 RepID=UPI000781CA56|nr:ATP-dependent helicase HrpB [Endozoicomonas arenosclerae]
MMPLDLPSLPVTEILPELADRLTRHDRVILQAPTGAGKTTLVPLYLLHQMNLPGKILMLEPRRLAASAAAIRMADLLSEPVGKTVGYRMQLENKVSKDTRIEVVTEGILTRMLQDDPELSGVSLVIFDEFHERSLQADLGLSLSLQCQEFFRDSPLKLLIMSATLQTEALTKALDAPLVISQGFSHPVEIIYRDQLIRDRSFFALCQEVCQSILNALNEQEGSLLVFLPGAGEIRQVNTLLNDKNLPPEAEILPLFGDMNLANQRKVIQPAKAGTRKIVLATNIAETSLTIEGIRIVIDAGQVRKAVFDPASGMTRLETRRTSKSSADQRKGRAGRLESGVCYRLWTESEQERLAAADTPEIEEADLSQLALELAAWGASPEELFWLNTPPDRRYQEAVSLLENLGALSKSSGGLTATKHGQEMSRLGAHPRISHMLIVSAEKGLLEAGCQLAAVLSERDLLRGDRDRSVDISQRLRLITGESSSNNNHSVRKARQLTRQWFQRLKSREVKSSSDNTDAYPRLLLAAYPDRIAQRRGQSNQYLLSSSQGVELDPQDPLTSFRYLVIPTLGGAGGQRNAKAFLASPVDLHTLYDELPELILEQKTVTWSSEKERVIAVQQAKLGALVLEEKRLTSPDPELIQAGLMAGIRHKGLNCLPWDKDSLQLRERMQFLAHFQQASETGWPAMTESALLNELEEWLGPYLTDMSKLDHLKKLSLTNILLSRLDWPQQQLLESEAPERWQAPSGSRIRIDYSTPEEPKISLRLQELFGALETPVIGFGQQPLTIEMLSPAQRPVQITRDLHSFWESTYQEVKKDLKGRYPKHYWPDNPLEAEATRFVRPRK